MQAIRFVVLVAAALGLGAAVSRAPARDGAQPAVMTVYKLASCGCCAKWVDHIKATGIQVKTIDVEDLSDVKEASGVPAPLQTCHTAVIQGYVVEGHVPGDVVQQLLRDKPAIAGVAVPGMPVGSPGMEGSPKQSYDVIAWDKAGKTRVFAHR
ncbi:MAG TPA: DUF411 domain-containing protein [Gemmatimonadales bacterium]|nr:DUF411 domain-containing protein [Gemmatimonadales bacterium]